VSGGGDAGAVGSRPRVVYVQLADPGLLTPAEASRRWPTMPATLRALAATGAVDAVAVARTRDRDRRFLRDGVEYRAVRDRSRRGWRVLVAVRAARPDVVHLNGLIFPWAAIALRLGLGRRARIVCQHHGEPVPPSRRARLLARLARWTTDAYLFTGAAYGQAEPWIAAGVLRATTPLYEVVESASDLVALEPGEARRRCGVDGDPAVVWVGRLNAGKDPHTALEAFAELAVRHPGARLWMLRTELADPLGVGAAIDADPWLRGRVRLAGPVAHAEMAAWYSAADLFLATSHHEGSGYALIEALACGAAPVVSDIAPHRAIVGAVARRFPPADVAAAAAALGAANAQRPSRSTVLAHAAAATSWEAIARQLLTAYGLPASAPSQLSGRPTPSGG